MSLPSNLSEFVFLMENMHLLLVSASEIEKRIINDGLEAARFAILVDVLLSIARDKNRKVPVPLSAKWFVPAASIAIEQAGVCWHAAMKDETPDVQYTNQLKQIHNGLTELRDAVEGRRFMMLQIVSWGDC